MIACHQLAKHFHCSPYDLFDKPSGEVWSIYAFVVEETKRQADTD